VQPERADLCLEYPGVELLGLPGVPGCSCAALMSGVDRTIGYLVVNIPEPYRSSHGGWPLLRAQREDEMRPLMPEVLRFHERRLTVALSLDPPVNCGCSFPA
jgi:hypothetical protein